jgi:hypothetical protein
MDELTFLVAAKLKSDLCFGGRLYRTRGQGQPEKVSIPAEHAQPIAKQRSPHGCSLRASPWGLVQLR